MSSPERAAILVRISDDRAGDAAGVGRQEADARALADRLGWQVAEVVTENDTSAFKRRKVTLPDGSTALRVLRPGFRRLLEMMTLGQIDGLICYHLDRVARDPRDLEDLIDAVERTHVPVESVTGSLRLATDSDVTMARIGVAIANQSSRDTSRRIRRKHEELAERGRFGGGGARRFGFERDGVTHVPAEAEAIRWAASRVLAGDSVSRVARELDARDIPPVKAVRWSARALTDILTSPRVAGMRVHRGEVVGKAVWQPILDEDTHTALVAAVQARSRGVQQPALRRWLNGVLICGRCGHALSGFYVKGRPYRYRCDPMRGGCNRISVDGPSAEAEVSRQVLDYLSRSDVLAALATTTSSAGAERARAELVEDEAQLKQLARLWGEKQVTLAEYVEARTVIEQRMTGARTVLEHHVSPEARKVLASGDVEAAWDAAEPTTKREVVRSLVTGWRVGPRIPGAAPRFDPDRLELVP